MIFLIDLVDFGGNALIYGCRLQVSALYTAIAGGDDLQFKIQCGRIIRRISFFIPAADFPYIVQIIFR